MIDLPRDIHELEQAPFKIELEQELAGASLRGNKFFEIVSSDQVDIAYVVVGCCDQRVETPGGTQEIIDKNGQRKNAMFHFVPSIGGGVANVLPSVITEWTRQENKAVPTEKIHIIVTSHGDGETILSGGEIVKCGALDARDQIASEISETLGVSAEQRESVMHYLSEHFHLSPALIDHIFESNFSSNAFTNAKMVYSETTRRMVNQNLTVGDVSWGVFEHQSKQIFFPDWTMKMPGLDEYLHKHQDPSAMVLSYGPNSVSVPDSIWLPGTVGFGPSNDFNSAAVDESGLWRAFFENEYPLHTKNEGNLNFASTDRFYALVDNNDYERSLLNVLYSNKFQEQFGSKLAKIGGIIYVANIESEKVMTVKVAKAN